MWTWSGSSSPDLHELLDLDDGDLRRRAHHRAEVARRLAEHEVAPACRAFHAWTIAKSAVSGCSSTYSRPSITRVSLPSATCVPDAGRRVEAADARAAGADALGERALRARARPRARPRGTAARTPCSRPRSVETIFWTCRAFEQDAEAQVGGAAVVRDDGEVLHALAVQRGDEVLRVAAQAEAADHEGRAVLDVRDRLVRPTRRACSCRCALPQRSTTSAQRLAAADAERREAALLAEVLHRVEQRHEDARAATRRSGDRARPRRRARSPSPGRGSSSWLFAIDTTANASLISQRSTSLGVAAAPSSSALLDRVRRRGGEPLGRLRAAPP